MSKHDSNARALLKLALEFADDEPAAIKAIRTIFNRGGGKLKVRVEQATREQLDGWERRRVALAETLEQPNYQLITVLSWRSTLRRRLGWAPPARDPERIDMSAPVSEHEDAEVVEVVPTPAPVAAILDFVHADTLGTFMIARGINVEIVPAR
jgi:hypothetical protein